MFKSKEDLIKEHTETGETTWNAGLKEGVRVAFASISERIKIYEECVNNPWELKEKYPKIYKESMKNFKIFISDYNHWLWLFHFCFDGVK